MAHGIRPLLLVLIATLAGGTAGCVAYPVYYPAGNVPPSTAPSTVYYTPGSDDGAVYCDAYYSPCTSYYGYGYYGGTYYGYPTSYVYIHQHRYPPYYGYYHYDGDHDHHGGHDRPHDRPRTPPSTSPIVPIRPPSDRKPPGVRPGKPPVTYAPKPPRIVPGDRRVPPDPGPSVQGSVRSPVVGRVVTSKPRSVSAQPRPQPSNQGTEQQNQRPQSRQQTDDDKRSEPRGLRGRRAPD